MRIHKSLLVLLGLSSLTIQISSAQGRQPYPNAITNQLIYQETPMLPPARDVVFTDPDFGSSMIRVTDATTNSNYPGAYFQTEGGEANEWSTDALKFYVQGKGGRVFAFGFDPTTMAVSSLPNAAPGDGLLLPLRQGPSFSFVDPDLIYGTAVHDSLTMTSYRFSTGASTPLLDTRTCGVQPPLGSGPSVLSDDDMSPSLDDTRFSISEGGPEAGKNMFVIVYDKNLGCRWYNTQTGQIGGQWGTTGTASVTTPYLINHAYLSRSGNFVVILVNNFGWYMWDLSTLTVSACPVLNQTDECAGYKAVGYNDMVNSPAITGQMQTAIRPLANIADVSQIVWPVSFEWGQERHHTWSNVTAADNTPVCGSTYSYDGDGIDQPYDGEMYCIETDGLASTIWRFAHNRATYISPYFQTQPLGSVSQNGSFLLFTSNWDAQLGTGAGGEPRADVFIVKLN
jgi:hypothetical protein